MQAGQPVLGALDFLRQLEHQRHPDMQQAPLDVVPRAWRRLVLPPREPVPDRRAYTLCAMERLHESLKRRDVFVPRSERWGDPRIKLLHGERRAAMWTKDCRALGRSESNKPEIN